MKTTQRQIVAGIEPSDLPGAGPGHVPGPPMETASNTNYFATVSGGEISASVEKIYDGNNAFPDVLCAPSEIGDISVSKFYDEQYDLTFLEQLRQMVGRVYYDVTIYTLDCDLVVSGSERVYPRCLLVGLSDIDGDASSGAPSSFSLTFAVSHITPTIGSVVA